MSPADFTVWLRGFMAALGTTPMTAMQAEIVRVELAKVVQPYPWTLTVLPVQPYNPVPVNPLPWGQPWITCDNGAPRSGAGVLDMVGGVGGGLLGATAGYRNVCGGSWMIDGVHDVTVARPTS